METEHTTIRLDADVKLKAKEAAEREHVTPAVIMRRWLREGMQTEEAKK